jgi:hypothetical protein
MITIPLLVPERVVDWAVRKGYLEFEHHPQAACEGDRGEHACDSAPVAEAVASAADAADAGDSRDNANQQLGTEALSRRLQQKSNELQRVSRYLIESQEYCTFLEAKLEQGEGRIGWLVLG